MNGAHGTMEGLYPPLASYCQDWLAVGDGHRLYWEESGNPSGVPVIFLHGGPGAGSAPTHRRFFDPTHYRIILFDQRGAGRSEPPALIENNSTAHLVEDIEALRRHLRVERWLVFGGSWGSTLGLAYGEAHPERCLGFILRGVFLFTPDEIDWFLHGMGIVFPEAARAFLDFLPEAERGDPLGAYFARLSHPDPAIHMPAAQSWCGYEESCSRLLGGANGPVEASPSALAMARIEAHYMRHGGFLAGDQLMRDLPRITHLPAAIVQGRYDIICPIVTADRLARAWPGADYRIVANAGHSALEPSIRAALTEATDRFRSLA